MATNLQLERKYLFINAQKILLIIALAGATLCDASASNEFTYTNTSTNIIISGYTGASQVVAIPDEIEGQPVTEIARLAFFRKTNITLVLFGNNMRTVGLSAFSGCSQLRSVVFNTNLASIGMSAFESCGLTQVEVPDSVTSLGTWVFFDCRSLTNAVIGNGVTRLRFRTFSGCSALVTATIGSGVTFVEDAAIVDNTALTATYWRGNAPQIGGTQVFIGSDRVFVYYKPGKTGWTTTFAGRPTAIWSLTYDEWSEETGLNREFPNARGVNDDPDKDGFLNGQEMVAGTSPLNGDSLLKFENQPRLADLTAGDQTTISQNLFPLYIQSIPGRSYRVYRADGVKGALVFATTVTATTTQKRIVLTRPSTPTFYRVQVVPLP